MTELSGPAGERNTVPVEELRATVRGRVLVPEDPGYEQARTAYLGGMDQRPAAIVQPVDDADVARVITLATVDGAPLAVRSGGHSPFALVDGGLVLDLSSLRDLQIDPDSRTAWAGVGLTVGEFTTAAHAHGLALGFGDSPSVGLGGITVGGGVGYLVRKYGLTIDNLLAAEIVTADGTVRRVDSDHEPELFWAIRGGGGNFGVVTRVRYRLHELSTIVGGLLVLPATPEVVAGFVEQARTAPEELSTILDIITAPPMPFLPDELIGEPVVLATLVYAGTGEQAEQAIAPFRSLATPIADMVDRIPYPDIYADDEDDFHPIAASRNLFMDELTREDAALFLDRMRASTADTAAVQIRVLGGASARVPNDATAYAHRGRAIMINVAAIYEDLDTADEHHRWADELTAALRKGVPGVYVNFLDDDRTPVPEAYPEPTWTRLRAVKRTYDPANLFRVNNNIPPAEDR